MISTAIFTIPLVNVLEWKIVDSWLIKTGDTIENKDIAVLEIDQEFVKKYKWPIDKNLYAELIDYLNEMGAKVIAFDVLLSDNTAPCDSTNDELFIAYLQMIPNIILIYSPIEKDEKAASQAVIPSKFSIGKGKISGYFITDVVMPYPAIMEAGPMIAHHNLAIPFMDGSYRRLPLLFASGDNHNLYPTLSLMGISLFQDTSKILWDENHNIVRVGHNQVTTDNQTQMLIDFRYKIPSYSFDDVFSSMKTFHKIQEDPTTKDVPEIGKKELEGKLIFIGVSDPLLGDNATTPMSGKGTVPKVRLHARSAATILNNSAIHNFDRLGAILFSLAIVLIMLSLFKLKQIKFCYTAFFTIIITSYFAGQFLYNAGYLIPIVEGLSAGLIYTLLASLVIFFEKDLARNFLFDSFKTYLSKEVIDDMYTRRVKPKLGGQEGICTAYFTDIQGFSSISEKLASPTKLVELLNEYLSVMTDLLIENQGTLDKYEGDAIVAFFGAPMEMSDHALKACMAAIKMQEGLKKLRKKWKNEGEKWPEIVHQMRMRVGINTGAIVTGNMGSKLRMNYTMMGDAVNLAARLESGAKQYGAYILVSKETMKMVKDYVFGRKIDIIRVVGKSEPVPIFEIFGLKDKKTPELQKCVELFTKGRILYSERKWDKAIEVFKQCQEYEPHHPNREPGCKTTPSNVYIKRCEMYKKSPPEENWDSIYTATEK
jgi:class 3 adenylate cyclase/CHASE2 domain-containing sensor protein